MKLIGRIVMTANIKPKMIYTIWHRRHKIPRKLYRLHEFFRVYGIHFHNADMHPKPHVPRLACIETVDLKDFPMRHKAQASDSLILHSLPSLYHPDSTIERND
jgi:hypothetical protein